MKLQMYIEEMGLNPKNFSHFFLKNGYAFFERKNRVSIFKRGIIAVRNNGEKQQWNVFRSDVIEEIVGTRGLGMFEKKGRILDVSSLEYCYNEWSQLELYANPLNDSFLGGVVYMEDMDELNEGIGEMSVLVIVLPEKKLSDAVVFLTAYERTQILELRSIAKMFFYGLGSVENRMFSELFSEEVAANERITEEQ